MISIKPNIAAMVVLAIIVLTVGILFGYVQSQQIQQIIPTGIKKQINFLVLVPNKTAQVTIDKKSIKYDAKDKLLIYSTQMTNGIKLTISEQATPESFTDVPQVYDKLIESLFQYSAFDSVNGKVFLTHPKELKGGQSAVMNAKGTLMFVKPSKDIDIDTWRHFFNNTDIIH